jgi:hypothetical protein
MSGVTRAFEAEGLKARRSRMPLFTALAFSLAPLAGGFFMVILKDPEMARRLGMISAKAQIVAGSADWPTYLGVMAQATAIGGFILFSFIASWVFGREYADHTVKDLLALPTRRRHRPRQVAVVGLRAGRDGLRHAHRAGVGALVGLPPAEAGLLARLTIDVRRVDYPARAPSLGRAGRYLRDSSRSS